MRSAIAKATSRDFLLLNSFIGLLLVARVGHSQDVDFDRQVRPIFSQRCVECHGDKQQKSSLRVDSSDELIEGGDSGAAIVPGDPDASYLVELISTEDPDMRMPPSDHGAPLTSDEVEIIRRWIAEGARGAAKTDDLTPVHWSFQPIQRPVVPRVGGLSLQPTTAIDAFLMHRLEEAGQSMSAPASARTFIRRVTLDLTGLPPSPQEVQAFVEECSSTSGNNEALPDAAVAGLVDRLLSSPHYGQRWAQHWLDVIRYADTSGYEKNKIRPGAWPYRDYVIAAFNSDIPYPRFILEQLAGDTVGVDPATGFLVTHPFPEPIEVGQEPKLIAQVRYNGLDEVVQNVSSSMLGLSVGCARCHDHKFDPISTKDYYRLAATFSGVDFSDRVWNSGMLPVERTRPIENRILEVRKQLQSYVQWREVEPTRVTDVFEPVSTRRVRLIIEKSSDEQYAPAIDELQVWSKFDNGLPARNVALASSGAIAHSSGVDEALDAQDEFLNDGLHGEKSLWVSTHQPDNQSVWVEVELPRIQAIDRVAWCQDRLQLSKDFIRLYKRRPVAYRIEVETTDGNWQVVADEPRSQELSEGRRQSRERLEKELETLSRRLQELQLVFAGSFRNPDPMYVLRRGDPQQPLMPIGPGGIDIVGSYELPTSVSETARRIALAEWLGSANHPLTARVLVNRVWMHHFGVGIVDTPGDFGNQGGMPSHPELLDWLAVEFMANGWSLKELHRQICTTAAYRQSSAPNAQAMAIDADTRLLWRFPPRRLEAEAIRDSMIFVADALDPKAGGPGVNLYSPERYGSQYIPREDPGAGPWRKSIYLLRVRGGDDGVFKSFDVPDCGQVRPKRTSSITPLQALNLFNSQFTQVIASGLAERCSADVGSDSTSQVERLFEVVLCRPASERERSLCVEVANQHGLATVCRAILNSNEFLFIQ